MKWRWAIQHHRVGCACPTCRGKPHDPDLTAPGATWEVDLRSTPATAVEHRHAFEARRWMTGDLAYICRCGVVIVGGVGYVL